MSSYPTPPYLIGTPQLPDDLAQRFAQDRLSPRDRRRITKRLITIKKEIRRRREAWEAIHGPWNAWHIEAPE